MPIRFVSRWISLPALISGLLLDAPAIAAAVACEVSLRGGVC